MPGYTLGTGWPVLTISFNLFVVAFPLILLSVAFAIRAAVAYKFVILDV